MSVPKVEQGPFLARIPMRRSTVCVLGLGYIGLPTAAMFAASGLHVTGVDTSPNVISALNNGRVHIGEPGLAQLVESAFSSRNLKVRPEPEEADSFIIAVPTPLGKEKQAELRCVITAAENIVPRLRSGNLVMLESTCPPGTTVNVVAPILERSGLKSGTDFYLCYSPERVLPGRILQELVENPRVIGGINRASTEMGKDLYTNFVEGEILLTDATTAEMTKLMENSFRDVNIALANEFSRLAQFAGVNVWEAIEIANRHPRVRILRPGPGVGGHCISIDPWFLVQSAPHLARLISLAREVNDEQPAFVVSVLQEELGSLEGRRIAVLGLAYKADVDDLRESPSVEVAELLAEAGAKVTTYEPNRLDAEARGCVGCVSLEAALGEAEVLLLTVPHHELKGLDPRYVRRLSCVTLVVDTCGVYDRRVWERAGLQFMSLGDGRIK
jgi:UDP-N-acetyl-D-mannosaminuronic acid dehydrogenase